MKTLRLFFSWLIIALAATECSGTISKTDNPSDSPKPSGRKAVVYLAGDSTCAPKSESDRPKYGWGEKFASFLNGNKVENKAVGGKSTKTFRSGGQWENILKSVLPGDVILIQFGHNDESTNSLDDRGTTPEEYYQNLCRYIAEAKSKEAIPVILTPICRRDFADGAPKHTHLSYPDQAKKAASDKVAVLLDIEQLTYDWLATLGEEASASRFMVSVDGKDNTHLTELGATEVAEIVSKALKTCGNSALESLVK